MQELSLQIKKRQLLGKQAKKLIEAGQVLGNIFGKGEKSQAIAGDYREVERVVEEAGKTHPVSLRLEDGKTLLTIISEIERDTISQKLHHVSFQIVKRDEKVETEVPIKFVGDAPATRSGNILVTLVDTVEVEALPGSIPEYFEISLEPLAEIGDSLTVGDLAVPSGVEILTDSEQLIAKIEEPRAEEEEEEEEEELDAADIPSDHGGEDEEAADGEGEQADTGDKPEEKTQQEEAG